MHWTVGAPDHCPNVGPGRTADDRGLRGRALRRDEVTGTSFAAEVFALVDALCDTEPRLAEIREFKDMESR